MKRVANRLVKLVVTLAMLLSVYMTYAFFAGILPIWLVLGVLTSLFMILKGMALLEDTR